MKKKISYGELNEVLSRKEMKNVKAGSGWYCCDFNEWVGTGGGCRPNDSCICSSWDVCVWLD